MSIARTFEAASTAPQASDPKRKKQGKAPAPFSLRLSANERAHLTAEASGAPLGTYIRAKLLDGPVPAKLRKSGIPIADRRILAQLVAFLGQSRAFSNLNQLAKLAHIGALPITPETEGELQQALADLRQIRDQILAALGKVPEARP